MARLRHGTTGVVVDVSGEKAAQLGAVFSPEGDDTPAQSASKAEWVDHAVSRGADRSEAESSTKAELQEQYG